jgi:hypothetical protein
MSVLPEHPRSETPKTDDLTSEHLAPVRLESRFIPATDSQLLVIETGLRLLAVWAVRATRSAEQASVST